jgi:phage terminase large subunit-like protein
MGSPALTASLPECGRSFDGVECHEVGDHLCEPRAEHIYRFFAELLVHVKGKYAGKAFVLKPWQFQRIIRPLFGTVVWSAENGQYVRRFRRAWIEIARKNGKSEILAGIVLYLLCGDGEAGAEVYGCARNRPQAALVFKVARQMVVLSPKLSKLLRVVEHTKKIAHVPSDSLYEVIPADADTALGSNPSGVAADEILAWRDRGLWDSLETGMGSGARIQPMMVAATTAGTTDSEFALEMHKTMLLIMEEPERSPHTFVFILNTPMDLDPWDEETWYFANPALGDFLSLESFRMAAGDAKNDPEAEQGFRQFRLNQWTKATFRWLDMLRYDEASAVSWARPDEGLGELRKLPCFVGMDLSSKMDLTAVCYLFPTYELGPAFVWRMYAPEEAVDELDRHNDGLFSKFVKSGWLTMHDGAVIDYDAVVEDMKPFAKTAQGLDADEWSSWPIISAAAKALNLSTDTEVMAYKNTYTSMTPGIGHLTALVKSGTMNHFGNPLARYCFESTQLRRSIVDPDQVRPDKPDRKKAWHRIDAVPAAAMACNAWKTRGVTPKRVSVYETRGVMVA